jgi:RND superfamily putative drug exporter
VAPIAGLCDEYRAIDKIKRVTTSTFYYGERVDRVDWSVYGEGIKQDSLPEIVGKNNQTVLITIVLAGEPLVKESIDLITVLQETSDDFKKSNAQMASSNIYVGGATASTRDIEHLIDENQWTMRILVVIGIFILLLIVLGSIIIPITAIISIALSISWTLALTMLVFEAVKGIPILWLMPLILFVVLMGLGMDYNIFIITRMREEVSKGKSDRQAIKTAVERTGGIVTACGVIMAGAFGSMMLSQMGILQQFGFGLSVAILIDAFIIRIYLMPAIIVLLKKWNWYAPGRLQRVRRPGRLPRKRVSVRKMKRRHPSRVRKPISRSPKKKVVKKRPRNR